MLRSEAGVLRNHCFVRQRKSYKTGGNPWYFPRKCVHFSPNSCSFPPICAIWSQKSHDGRSFWVKVLTESNRSRSFAFTAFVRQSLLMLLIYSFRTTSLYYRANLQGKYQSEKLVVVVCSTKESESRCTSHLAQCWLSFISSFAFTAEVTAKPTIDSKLWQTPADDKSAWQEPCERQRTPENIVSHFG